MYNSVQNSSKPKSVADLDRALRVIDRVAGDLRATSGLVKSLWPAELSQDTPECAKAFVFGYVWSYEETSGLPMKAPDWPALHRIIDAWFETKNQGRMLSIEKSRRLWVSWLLCALDVWEAGRKNITVIQGGKDYDKASDFVFRCWYIYEQLRIRNPKWSLPVASKWGNEQTKRLDMVAFSTGAIAEPLNSDGESFRGSGYARVKLEEHSNYRHPEGVSAQAALVTQGPPTKDDEEPIIGGHVVSVNNASANDEWQAIKAYPDGYQPPEPYADYISKAGVRCLRISYKCDPLKTPEWEIAERARGGITKRKWDLEMGLDDTIYEGRQVHEDFAETLHVPLQLKSNSWIPDPAATYILGMDAGNTMIPAGVLLEIGPEPWYQLVIVYEWIFLGNTPMSKAIDCILDGGTWDNRTFKGLKKILPGTWDAVEWWGDATIISRQGAYGHTAQGAALEKGIQIKPISNILDARLGAVDWALVDMIQWEDERGSVHTQPRMWLCAKDCPTLLAGFRGAYRRMEVPGKTSGHDLRMPEKNKFSHAMDGLQACCLVAKDIVQGKRPAKKKAKRRRR